MRYPHFLKENGSIGFVAPAFGCNIEPYHSAFLNALSRFADMGYATKIGPNCFAGDGIGISSSPEKCAAEFMEAWQDPDSDILISCGGGELMCEILPYIDFETLKNTPAKWFQGYSDNTNLAFLLATLCDTAAIYGPCAPAFGMEPWHPAIADSFALLCGKDPARTVLNRGQSDQVHSSQPQASLDQDHPDQTALIQDQPGQSQASFCVRGYDLYEAESLKDEDHPLLPYHVTEPCRRSLFLPAGHPAQGRDPAALSFSGRLLGGCLDILCMLAGTGYDRTEAFCRRYADDGIIWFLEACDLNVMSIRRALWQLDQAGWFSHVKGFLIGRPFNGEAMFGLDRFAAVTGILQKYRVPILMDLDIGHIPPMMPLIEGSLAEVSMQGNDLSVWMKLA